MRKRSLEDNTLGARITGWCRDTIYVPTNGCMNLAATVNVVLYDRLAAGLSGNGIDIDRCIVDQVISLWQNGIRTQGSCCGHNKAVGFINVDERDFDKAIALGWEKYFPERS